MPEIRASRIGGEYDPDRCDPLAVIRDEWGVLRPVGTLTTAPERRGHGWITEAYRAGCTSPGAQTMSIADRPRAEIMERLRLTESQLDAANRRNAELELIIGRFRSEKPEFGDLSFREQIRSQLIEQGLNDSEAKAAAGFAVAVAHCARIAYERALIEQGRGLMAWRGAYQAARDICVLNGLDPDIIDGFDDEQQVSIRALFSEKQQDDAAKARAQIEQPSTVERLTKDEWSAINKLRGEAIDHKINSGVETPLFTALQKIADWYLEPFDQQKEEALRNVEALAQIEPTQSTPESSHA